MFYSISPSTNRFSKNVSFAIVSNMTRTFPFLSLVGDMSAFSFQPLLVTIVTGDDGNDYETYSPLCPYGKKCTYGSKCKYFHVERRQSATNSMLQTKSSPEHLHMYSSPVSHEQSLADDARLAYEYGLTSTPMTNEFSFVDQRLPPHWFGTAPSFVPRTMSMPQPIVPNDLFMMQQQQQHWLRQQFDQVAERSVFLSLLSRRSIFRMLFGSCR